MTELKAYDFTPEEVSKLLTMQDELNTYIHPEWKTQGFNWGLAILDECMEIHGHLGWKWWKKDYQVGLTESNLKQVQLEVIDILHFGLSSWIEDGFDTEQLVWYLNNQCHYLHLGNNIQDVMEAAICTDCLDVFAALAHSVGLTKQQILETYIQKYVLNKFRQDHGYKTGEYAKLWKIATGVCDDQWKLEEDNYWLKQVSLGSIDEKAIYSSLQYLYNSRLNK